MPLSNYIPSSRLIQPGVCTSSTRPASPFVGQCIFETDTGRTLLWDGSAWVGNQETLTVALSDEISTLIAGTGKTYFRAPFNMKLYQIPRAFVSTASTSGNPTVDIKVGGSSIFSTLLSIDANEKTSTTAATAAVLSTTTIADDAEISFDLSTAGTGTKGLKVTLYFRRYV